MRSESIPKREKERRGERKDERAEKKAAFEGKVVDPRNCLRFRGGPELRPQCQLVVTPRSRGPTIHLENSLTPTDSMLKMRDEGQGDHRHRV